MTHPDASRRGEHGMTLVELLIAMVVFLIILAGAIGALGAQSRGFNKGAEEMGLLQNLRYGVQQMSLEFPLAGANLPDRQPPAVYASGEVFAFNADVASNLPGDISAVYIDPSAPAGQVSAWPLAQAAVIAGSSPAFTYPLADFGSSPAETITYQFVADPETTRPDDFLLVRRVNDRPPEVLVRRVLRPAGNGPFFAYHYLETPNTGPQVISPVPAGWLPLRHSAPQHGQLPDTGTVARIDLLRAVEIAFRVTNGETGAAERIRAVRTTVPLPNLGIRKLQSCGDVPMFGRAVVATPVVVSGVPQVEVTWQPGIDETGGETDIIRYAIWRRTGGTGPWGDPVASLAAGAATYLFTDADVATGLAYQYAVAAQDCTPALSTPSVSNLVVVP
jgi:prepilin-type N-terminal cleavage/methylation domain-containing protein